MVNLTKYVGHAHIINTSIKKWEITEKKCILCGVGRGT